MRFRASTNSTRCCRKATGWNLIGVEGLLPGADVFRSSRQPALSGYLVDPQARSDRLHRRARPVPRPVRPRAAVAHAGVRRLHAGVWARWRKGARHQRRGAGESDPAVLVHGRIRLDPARTTACASTAPASSRRKANRSISLESPAPNRIGFDLKRIMHTRYRIDTYQKSYFVIDSFEQLMEATRPDFRAALCRTRRRDVDSGRRSARMRCACSIAAAARAGRTMATYERGNPDDEGVIGMLAGTLPLAGPAHRHGQFIFLRCGLHLPVAPSADITVAGALAMRPHETTS